MEAKSMKLYKQLGYKGPSRTKSIGRKAKGVAFAEIPELPPISGDGLKSLKKDLLDPKKAPKILERARVAWDSTISIEELYDAIEEAEMAMASPDTYVSYMKSRKKHDAKAKFISIPQLHAKHLLPKNFHFNLMTDSIPIDPSITRFEPKADALGWVIFSGPYLVSSQLGAKAPFRWHNNKDKFTYEMIGEDRGIPIKIALFSDFGTGVYHSLYVAKQITQGNYDYAFHLGDVYYSGRQSEFEDNFEKPLQSMLSKTPLFMLNANHEMLSKGRPYYDFIDKKASKHPKAQKQTGSYFCVRSKQFQIIGIDTDYYEQGRHKNKKLNNWLKETLQEGKDAGSINILLSANEPYEYGKNSLTELVTKDLRPLVKNSLIDLWFWGNTHYCALFDKSNKTPFFGSCIGHGGFPYDVVHEGEDSPAKVMFLETEPRFPKWTGIRQRLGNNGFCSMELNPNGDILLKYIDWTGSLRCETMLSKTGTGKNAKLVLKSGSIKVIKRPDLKR
jgi:hypothetical protein